MVWGAVLCTTRWCTQDARICQVRLEKYNQAYVIQLILLSPILTSALGLSLRVFVLWGALTALALALGQFIPFMQQRKNIL